MIVLRLAAFADLHGHIYKEFDTKADGLTNSSRLNNIVESLRYIRDWCIDNDVKYVLFAGDLFHVRAKVDTVVFNAIYNMIETFHMHGLEIIMIAGNHDQYDNSDIPENSLHAFKKLEGVHVYDTVDSHLIKHYEDCGSDNEPDQFLSGEVEIVCAPYSKNAQLVKDYIAGVEKKDIPQILLFHLGIAGAFVGSGNYPMADAFKVDDLRPDLFKYIIGGHFHKRQFLGGHPHAFYCGAPIQHSFGDEGEDKGFYVVDTNKRYDVEFVPIPNPKFLTFSGGVKDMTEEYLSYAAVNGNYVRFLVTPEQLEEYKKIIPHNLIYKVELQREYVEQERSGVKIGMSFEDIITKYAEENNPAAKVVGLEILREVQG